MRIPKLYVCLFLLPVCAFAQGNTLVGDSLPVKRVVLYKSGVGYFEHLGRVRESQDVTIPFTSGQLNDVLKSLTVLDLNGGRITGVEYGSAAPMDRQLGDLRLPVGEKASLTEFLGALRGARLEVRSGTSTITGRLLSVERKTRIAGGTTLEVDYLSLIADNRRASHYGADACLLGQAAGSRVAWPRWIDFSMWCPPAAKPTCAAW